MKNKALLLLLILTTTVTKLIAQVETPEYDRTLGDASVFMKDKKMEEALPLYLQLIKKDTLNFFVNYQIGICYLNSRGEKAKAIPYLERAVKCDGKCAMMDKKMQITAISYLGDAYHSAYQFDLAMETYKKYKHALPPNKEEHLEKEINRKIVTCIVGKELMANPVDVKIEDMGANINSPYPDYSPVLSADESTVIFTTRRPEREIKHAPGADTTNENIYIAYKKDTVWTKAQSIGSSINTDGNEASVGISVDGQIILIYKDDSGGGDLFSTSLNGDKWSVPVRFNDNINTKGWEPSAFISADGMTL